MRWAHAVVVWVALASSVMAASPDIPSLAWAQRSDWINVTSDVTPAAIGDGRADDTAAIQAALDRGRDAKGVYLPPGTYRITQTLVFQGPAVGCLMVGHGRDTQLVWDGSEGGRMFWSNGVAYSRYVGLSWDGRGKAAVGFDHAAEQRFETEVRHEHEAFRNFTGFGIRVGNGQKIASAEILYHNCLFENCGTALAFLDFNPTLRVRDNHSIVMSDFYNEQSDQHLVFEGAAGQPEGSATIQGPKMHMFSQEPVFTIHDYAGRIYYGQSQFYIEPKEPRFVSSGTRPVRLILAGHFWYNTKPRMELGPEVTLTLLGNRDIPDTDVDREALHAMAAALDDLRRLGELDYRLSCQLLPERKGR